VQDEVVGTIAGILAAHVRRAETERTRSKPPSGWQAYDYYLRGVDYYNGAFSLSLSAEDLAKARDLFHQSLAIDPDYARSHAMLATSYCAAWVNPVDSDFLTPEAIDRAEQLARKAIQLDPNLSFARAVLAIVLVWRRDYEACMNQIDRAVALNPNNPDWRLGMIDLLEACRRLDPFHHLLTGGHLGFAHYMVEQYAQALPFLRDFTAQAPKFQHGHLWLAATLARLGLLEEARAEVQAVQRLQPKYASTRSLRQIFSFKHAKDAAHFLDALRKAGLPE
jgi:tetratricopeptide (TPR) repeat protein